MQGDPVRKITEIDVDGVKGLTRLDCGHLAELNTRYAYEVGHERDCFQCRPGVILHWAGSEKDDPICGAIEAKEGGSPYTTSRRIRVSCKDCLKALDAGAVVKKTTTFYLHDGAEALLHETILATVFDSVGVSIMCLNAPYTPNGREPDEGSVAYASRAWSDLLPGSNASGLSFRMRYGWTREEICQILQLLRLSAEECRMLATKAQREGTKTTLLRDAERFDALIQKWKV